MPTQMSPQANGPVPGVELTPGVCGGKPRIAGTRIRVQDVAIWHERLGCSADEIVSAHPQLTLAGVYGALSYYHAHREQIDEQMKKSDDFAESLREKYPSKLGAKLERST